MTDWTLSDGTIPSTRCDRCQRPTPMLICGLGFDCCAPDAHVGETLQAESEHPMADALPLRWAIPLAFGLAVILTIVGASA